MMKTYILAITCLFLTINAYTATINVCSGMKFVVTATEVGKETFDSAPKIYAEIDGKRINAKVLTARSSFPAEKVTCVWLADSPAGKYVLNLKSKDDDVIVVTEDFNVKSPEIYSFYPSAAETGDIVTLTGKYFGRRFNAWLETDSGQKVKCCLLKPYKYSDWKGKLGKSAMDPETGESSARIRVTGKLTTSETGTVKVENKSGSCERTYNIQKKKWTFLIYSDGDNNLDADLIKELESLAKVGSSDDVNVVVQMDRAKGDDNHGEYGGWTITNRFYVTKDLEPTQENAIQDWEDGNGGGREVDMSSANSLSDFVNWGAIRYPAEKYILVISNHGFGWRGLCIDETSGGSHLFIKDVKSALDKVNQKMDLLFFCDCLMQNVEASLELKDSGPKYIVASEAPLSPGYPYDALLADLAEKPDMSELDLAKALVDHYSEASATSTYYTLSAIDTAKVDDFISVYKTLTISMYDGSDISTIKSNAAKLMTQLEMTVAYSKAGGETAACRGLTVYFPELMYVSGIPMPIAPNDYAYFYNCKMLDFPNEANWKIFLDSYLRLNSNYKVPLEIYNARKDLELYSSGMIDIYQFCDKIVNSKR